jgi:hypothetical protein
MSGSKEASTMAARAFVITLLLATAGCDLSNHCDPGQIYMNHDCFNVPDAAASGDGGGDDGGASPGDDGAAACQPYQGFGDTCTDVSMCSCGLDSCNTFMGNYCTHTHCLADPTICPPGWTCLDLSSVDPTTGSACVKP